MYLNIREKKEALYVKTTGEKIKSLRIALGLSQEQLSETIDVAHKSIYRYETGKSLPDTTTLVKLATYFDVSTDYLLGLSGLKNQRKEEYGKIRQSGKYNEIYKHYLQSRELHDFNNNETYFWIFSTRQDGEIIYGGQTEWCGWTDESKTVEIRKLRPVIPEIAYKWCCQLYSKPMIISSEYDAAVFRIFGGQAIISQEICDTYFPELVEFQGPNPQYNLDTLEPPF